MRIAVAGGSGVLGRGSVSQLVARGYQVTASTTNPDKLAGVAELGAKAVVVDGLEAVSAGESVASATPTPPSTR